MFADLKLMAVEQIQFGCIANYKKTCHTLKILSLCRFFFCDFPNYRKRWWWWLQATILQQQQQQHQNTVLANDSKWMQKHKKDRDSEIDRLRTMTTRTHIQRYWQKCQANSSYVDDHVIRITNHIIPLTWMHAALRYIKRYADDSPACLTQYKSRFDAKCVFWLESK